MAGTTKTRERRRTTLENQAIRRTIDAVDWAAGLPPEQLEESRDVLRRTHAETVEALRQEPNRATAFLEMKVAPLPAAIVIAAFLLGLGIGLSFGGAS